MENKRGDVSSAFLITLILGVLAFTIILIVYSQFSWTASADQQTCHQSVIYRATLPSALGAKTFVPLKCKTENFCFTSGIIGGKCKGFENTKGVTNIKVSKKEQVEQAIARKIIDCWSMMGESKVSLFNDWMAETYGMKDIMSSCVICSRIAFDKESLAKSGIDTSEISIMDYMRKHLIPGKNITYYDYLGGNKGQISVTNENMDRVLKDLSEKLSGNFSESSGNPSVNNQNLDSDELAIMFMQVTAPTYGEVFKNDIYTILGIGGSSFVTAPVLTSKLTLGAGKLAFSHPIGAAIAAIVGIGVAGYQVYTVFNNNAIAAGYCGDVVVGDKVETGCSVVRTINYGAEDLSAYCSTIESIG